MHATAVVHVPEGLKERRFRGARDFRQRVAALYRLLHYVEITLTGLGFSISIGAIMTDSIHLSAVFAPATYRGVGGEEL